jgi:DNA repair protein RadC
MTLGSRDREVFVAVLLDAQHRVIATEELFQGTLTQTSVFPREIVKCALRHNAAAIIFAQNVNSRGLSGEVPALTEHSSSSVS